MTDIQQAGIILFDGVESQDVFGPFEVLSAGAMEGAAIDVTLVTAEPADSIETAHGAVVVPETTVDALDPDVLVVPGGGWSNHSGPGARAEAERGTIPDLLAERADDTVVLGVCTGVMLMARAGLLDGLPAVTHRSALEDLRGTEAEVVNARVLDAGDVLTAAGVTSGLDLGLYYLEREFGSPLAVAVEEYLEYERRGTVYRAEEA